MYGLGGLLLLNVLLSGCQSDNDQSYRESRGFTQQVGESKDIRGYKPYFSQNDQTIDIEDIVLAIPTVTDAVVVHAEKHILVGVQVKQFARFRMKEIRKEAYDLLTDYYHHDKEQEIHVSTDWKIYKELGKLKKLQENSSKEQVQKKVKELEKKMKG
ncbi:hypothetical protein J2S11_000470 [Bacillus horti]|uniref:Sporulation protein n=2 Tax=Caldalkalibacillus horti TaxID=77523 RepID=A0ABT9VUL7_9BACI|nr:hypothetical protein [Bacillus horti]